MTNAARPIRVLVAGRHPVVRAGLRGLLTGRSDVEVIGEATPADDLDPIARELQADVVLLEWTTPEPIARGGAAGAATDTPILLLGGADAEVGLQQLLNQGVRGFLLQDATSDEVADAAIAVARGLVVVDAALAVSAFAPFRPPAVEAPGDDALTERERQILELLAEGLPNKTIAQRLGISEHTVKFHVGSVLAKLGAASRTEAVAVALRRGLLAL